jgi:hypothetical protein
MLRLVCRGGGSSWATIRSDGTARTKVAGYQGSDPIADHVLSLAASGDGTTISIGSGDQAHTLVTLEHVAPTALKPGVDYVWH